MTLAEATSESGNIRVMWSLSEVEYDGATLSVGAEEEAVSAGVADEYAALDFIDFGLVGKLQVFQDRIGLFRASPNSMTADGMPVLRDLLGLRQAVILAVEVGPQTMDCGDEAWVSVWADQQLVRLTSFHALAAAEAEWLQAFDTGLAQLRSWINDHVPVARGNVLLGPWLRGGSPPQFSEPLPRSGSIL